MTDGVWSAASDHLAVSATVEHMSGGRELPSSFATRTLSCPKNAVIVAKHYRREMPFIEAMLHRAETACDIDNAYANFLEEVLRPWIEIRGTRSPKYKWFWDDKLQRMAKDRDKLYKKAVRTNNKATWEEHRNIDRAIKRSIYRKNRGARRREIESMMHMSVPRTQAWLKKQVRKSKQCSQVCATAGTPLDPCTFTTHMATKQEDATFANCRLFHTSPDFPEKLINTIAHLPGGTAPGPDGVY